MKIGIILGSIRQERLGASVARWVADQAVSREGVDYELIDLKVKVAAEIAVEEAAAEGRRQAQDTFEQGYWEYLDGRDSDFDPTFYDNDGNLIDR